jgi:hypothetical protein
MHKDKTHPKRPIPKFFKKKRKNVQNASLFVFFFLPSKKHGELRGITGPFFFLQSKKTLFSPIVAKRFFFWLNLFHVIVLLSLFYDCQLLRRAVESLATRLRHQFASPTLDVELGSTFSKRRECLFHRTSDICQALAVSSVPNF